jgi:hypothetical protein
MTPRWRSGWDPLAATAVAIALVMLVFYVALIRQQEDQPAVWFVAGLALAVVLAAYGVNRAAGQRTPALATAGMIMVVFGVLGILSIGLPVLVAGVLALVAAVRSAPGGR